MQKTKKIKSNFRLFSPILAPIFALLLVFVLSKVPSLDILNCFNNKTDNIVLQECKEKIKTIVGLDGTFIGVLITIFTIYISFPLGKTIRKRFKESKHQSIFIHHIWLGIILYTLSIFAYLFADAYMVALLSFCMGMSNFIATAYYITVLVSYIDDSK